MFQIFVDSAANLPAVIAKQYNINVISFVNLVSGKEITCYNPDLSPEEEREKGSEYYNAMRKGCEIKTGLISIATFKEKFQKALQEGQDVLYFSLSKNISGTYNSARLAAEDLSDNNANGHKIRLIDSLNASLAQGILAIYASIMRDKGMAVDEVADFLESCVGKMNGIFTVGDLKYLSQTGRIKGSVAAIGSLCNFFCKITIIRSFYDKINIIRRAFYYGKTKETCTQSTNDRWKKKYHSSASRRIRY